MALDLLTPEEIDFIRADFKAVMEDVDYAITIIYRRVTTAAERVFDPSTGAVTRTVVDIELRSVMANHGDREIAASGGLLKIGDVFFLIDPSLLSAAPRPDDQILCEVTSTGHLALTQGSATVVGYNTQFLLDGVQGGDLIVTEEDEIDVRSVTSDTLLTARVNWAPVDEPAIRYKLYRVYELLNNIVDPLQACLRISARRAGA